MRVITNENIPIPGGHYSTCIEHKGLLYLSGQLPFNLSTNLVPKGIEAQTQQVLDNVKTILEAAGSGIDQVLQARIYISNIEDWDTVNKIYAVFFGDHKPARCIVPVGNLHYGALIEFEATAIIKYE